MHQATAINMQRQPPAMYQPYRQQFLSEPRQNGDRPKEYSSERPAEAQVLTEQSKSGLDKQSSKSNK